MHSFRNLDTEQIEQLLNSNEKFIVFKHSYRCAISSTVLNRVEGKLKEVSESLPVYLIDVVQERSLSQDLASRINIKHESPQIIMLNGSTVVNHASHMGITPELITAFIHSKN
ncbi:bacillithiol system redox-active protein YtxJ [bacterium]|nr:bacillithiol system redox-active protein YtxJ [bacterium]